MTGAGIDFGVLKPEHENVALQSVLEKRFYEFFGRVVSEWNPCYDDAGACRYTWDDEVGAFDVDLEMPDQAAAETPPAKRQTTRLF